MSCYIAKKKQEYKMSSSTPIPPNRASDLKSITQAAQQQVEKVREIDPDEQARRQQRFQQMMGEDNESDDEEGIHLTASPLNPDFYFTSNPDMSSSGYDSEPIANPSQSPPPNVNHPTQPAQTDTKLPHSKKFWKKTDISEEALPAPTIKEVKKQPKETPSKKGEKKELEPSPFGAPGKQAEKIQPTKLIPKAKPSEKPIWAQPQE